MLAFFKTMPMLSTLILLVVSNIFMTLAWYGHLKLQSTGISSNWPLYVVILMSWGIALLEYCFQVPANRIGFEGNGGPYSLMQLKVIQEIITLVVFVVFSMIAFDSLPPALEPYRGGHPHGGSRLLRFPPRG